MPLQILAAPAEPTTLRLALDGKLDAMTAPELDGYFASHLGEGTKTLILDLAHLSFISSAGLRTFAKMRKTMHAREGKLCFVNLSPQVEKVFEIVKAVPNSDVFRNLEELDAYLTAMQNKVASGLRP